MRRADMDETNTIAPARCSFMTGMTAFVMATAPNRLTSKACRHVSMVLSSIRSIGGWMNALLTRMSMRPSSVIAASASAAQCDWSVTSVQRHTARRPSATTSSATFRSRSSVRAPRTTSAPSRAKARAVSRPIPGPMPETTATRSFSNTGNSQQPPSPTARVSPYPWRHTYGYGGMDMSPPVGHYPSGCRRPCALPRGHTLREKQDALGSHRAGPPEREYGVFGDPPPVWSSSIPGHVSSSNGEERHPAAVVAPERVVQIGARLGSVAVDLDPAIGDEVLGHREQAQPLLEERQHLLEGSSRPPCPRVVQYGIRGEQRAQDVPVLVVDRFGVCVQEVRDGNAGGHLVAARP